MLSCPGVLEDYNRRLADGCQFGGESEPPRKVSDGPGTDIGCRACLLTPTVTITRNYPSLTFREVAREAKATAKFG